MNLEKKMDIFLLEKEDKIDWKQVEEAAIETAEAIFGDEMDKNKVKEIVKAVKKKSPKDTEDAIGMAQGMLRAD